LSGDKSQTGFIVCVPYYSLPEFPPDCIVVRDHDVLIRDILLCNRRNFHIRGGVQFDPYIEHLEYMNCQPRVRRAISEKTAHYTDLYILFRTLFGRFDGSSTYLLTGYYKVKPDSSEECRDAPVIKASKAKFVSIEESIDITDLMNEKRSYRSCPTTENEGWKELLNTWLDILEGRQDLTDRYVREIQRLKLVYGQQEFIDTSRGYSDCEGCHHNNNSCPLVWRRCHRGIPPKFPQHFLL